MIVSMKGIIRRLFLMASVIIVAQVSVTAQEDDTIHYYLEEVTLIEHRNQSAISGNMASGIRIDSKLIQTYPKIFGYTDPMRYLQSLPGVSTNSDQSGGLHVQGGESSHNLITVSGTPLYGTANFTGLFSLLNQDHLPKVEFSTSGRHPFIGAELSLDHADTIPKHFSGTATLGLISGQGTFSVPLSTRTVFTLSLRRSFINTFYGPVLEFDGNPLGYGFTDANMTLLHRIDKHNDIDANMLWSHDKGESTFGASIMKLNGTWGNTLGAVRWRFHKPGFEATTSAFMSRFQLDGSVDNEVVSGNMSFFINHSGIKSAIKTRHEINVEADVNMYNILPQDPQVSRNLEGTASQPLQHTLLGNLYVSRTFHAGHHLSATPHLLFSAYSERGHYKDVNADPAITLDYDMFRNGLLTFESGIKHQYLSQTGITNVGLPIEFWVAAGRYFKPQKSIYATLSYDMQFMQGKYSLLMQVYGKRLYNQLEYTGFIFDMLSHPYRLEDNLLICSGYNYGLGIILSRQAGRMTGWLSYSYGQSLREGDGVLFPTLFHSSHERSHEFNAVLSYKIGKFDLGGTFIVASGNPYTPAKTLYLLANNLVLHYDSYNSANLPPYLRLDLSATYNFKRKGRMDHSINLSVFNSTAHSNYTMAYIRGDVEKQTIRYKFAKLVIPVIPSISYSYRF